jgi:hypothetical protein
MSRLRLLAWLVGITLVLCSGALAGWMTPTACGDPNEDPLTELPL